MVVVVEQKIVESQKGASLKEEKKIRAEYASILRVKKMDPWHRLKDYFDLTYVGPMERAFFDREKIKKFEYLDILVVSSFYYKYIYI